MNQDFDILNSIFVFDFYIIYCSSGERDIVIRELCYVTVVSMFKIELMKKWNEMKNNLMKYNQYQYVNQ